jgi:preprotein translocase subunit YajC
MFISEALAQTTSAPASGPFGDPMSGMLFYMLALVVIFYFLVIRPQSTRAKQHRELIEKVRRGDTVITAGGFIGRVLKASENSDEVEVELSEQMKVRVLKSTLMDVRSKGEPVKDTTTS